MSSSRRMKQRPQERPGRLFQGLNNTPVMGTEVLLLAINAQWADNKPLVASKPCLGKQKTNPHPWLSTGGVGLVFPLLTVVWTSVFKTETDLWLQVGLERPAVGALEGVRPDDCRKDWRLVVDDRVRTRDLSKLIYVKCWWIFLSVEPVNLLKILQTDVSLRM